LKDVPIYSGCFDEFGDEIPLHHDFKRFPDNWKVLLAKEGIHTSQQWNGDQRSGYNQTLFYLFQRSAKRSITFGTSSPHTRFNDRFEQEVVLNECGKRKEIFVATLEAFKVILQDELDEAIRVDGTIRALENPLMRGNLRLHVGYVSESITTQDIKEYHEPDCPRTGRPGRTHVYTPNFLKWLAHYSQSLNVIEMPNMQKYEVEVEDDFPLGRPRRIYADQYSSASTRERVAEDWKNWCDQHRGALGQWDVPPPPPPRDPAQAEPAEPASAQSAPAIEPAQAGPAEPAQPMQPEPSAEQPQPAQAEQMEADWGSPSEDEPARDTAADWAEQAQEQAQQAAAAASEQPMADTEQPLQWDNAVVSDSTVEPSDIQPHPLRVIEFNSWEELKTLLADENDFPSGSAEIRWSHGDTRMKSPLTSASNNPEDEEEPDEEEDPDRSSGQPTPKRGPKPRDISDAGVLAEDIDEEERFRRGAALLPGRPLTRITEDATPRWSGQLSLGVYNLGNLSRRPTVRWGNQSCRRNDDRFNMMVELLARNSCHVMTVCEAAGLERPEFLARLRGWKLVMSYDSNMSIGVRGDDSTTVRILFDNTHPDQESRVFSDDPTPLHGREMDLWYMIAEIFFGEEEVSEEAEWGNPRMRRQSIKRAGMHTVRVLVFHAHCEGARIRCGNSRKRYRQMFYDIAKYEVDLIGGDANASMYRFFSTQRSPSIGQSNFHLMLQKFIRSINRLSGGNTEQNIKHLANKIGADFISSNSSEALLECGRQVAEGNGDLVDCDTMVAVVVNWGHNVYSRIFRTQGIESQLTPEGRYGRDINHIGLRETSELHRAREPHLKALKDPLGIKEFLITTNEYNFGLGREHLWLGDNDNDWHSPLTVTIRPLEAQNRRKRSAASYAARAQKRAERAERNPRTRGGSAAAGPKAPPSSQQGWSSQQSSSSSSSWQWRQGSWDSWQESGWRW
jgi:hypothetical protein